MIQQKLSKNSENGAFKLEVEYEKEIHKETVQKGSRRRESQRTSLYGFRTRSFGGVGRTSQGNPSQERPFDSRPEILDRPKRDILKFTRQQKQVDIVVHL